MTAQQDSQQGAGEGLAYNEHMIPAELAYLRDSLKDHASKLICDRAIAAWNRRVPSGHTGGPVAWLIDHPEHGKSLDFAAITSADRAAGFSARGLVFSCEVRNDHREFVNRVGRMPHPADDDYSYPGDDDAEREALNGLIADARDIMAVTPVQPAAQQDGGSAGGEAVARLIVDLRKAYNDMTPGAIERANLDGHAFAIQKAIKILSALQSGHPASGAEDVGDGGLRQEARFLLERLKDFDVPGCVSDEGLRDWMGHVEPSIARLRRIVDQDTPQDGAVAAPSQQEGGR